MRISLAACVAVSILVISEPSQCAEIEIAPFKDNKSAAVSLTFDDAFDDHHELVAPTLEKYGFRGTFFVIIRHVEMWAGWEPWKALAARGHEVGNHTWNHPNITKIQDPEELRHEVIESRDHIQAQIGQPVVSFAYPFAASNAETEQLVLQHHDFARKYEPLYGGKDFTAEQANKWVTDAIENGKWHIGLLHSVSEETGFNPLPEDVFIEHLEFLKANEAKLWVNTYGRVARYLRDREETKVEVLENETKILRFKLSAHTGPERQPLTVVVRLGDSFTKEARVTQGDESQQIAVENGLLTFDVQPGGEPVRVDWNSAG